MPVEEFLSGRAVGRLTHAAIREIVRALGQADEAGMRVFELGARRLRESREYAQASGSSSYTMADYSPYYLDRMDESEPGSFGRMLFTTVGKPAPVPAAERFDLAICNQSVHQSTDVDASLRRIHALLAEQGLLPDVVHTSLLRRAIHTACLSLDRCDRHWIPVRRSWRLNERHYGALQGLNKAEIREKYGEDQFMAWRRSYDVPPPPIDPDGQWSQFHDARYADVPEAERPLSECLKDVVARMLPYWESDIVPDLRAGRTVLVAAHGNSLRALVKHLDEIDDQTISGLNIPTGIPLLYELDDALRPVVEGGRYLDPEAAEAGQKAVANQGRK